MAQILEAKKIVPPKIEWIWLENYPLSDLQQEFNVADFERRISGPHVSKILDGILCNEFYDIVIRAIKKPDGKYALIDGQHRINAFIRALKEHGLKKYTFMLALYPPEEARKIYRRINIGKKLTTNDHTKAMDDGTVPFFNELHSYFYHYRNQERMSFVDIIYTHQYAIHGVIKGRFDSLDLFIKDISEKDREFIVEFVKAFKDVDSHFFGNPIYKSAIYRNIYRVSMDKKYRYQQIVELIFKVKKMPELEQLAKGRLKEDYDLAYSKISNLK